MKFTWVDFYIEFATKLLEYKNNRLELISKILKIFKKAEMKLPKMESDGIPWDIDPFTVFGLFNKGLKNANRIAILEGIAEEFEIQAKVPDAFDGIPVVNPLMATFYGFGDDRNEDDIDNLWEVFEAALNLADDDTPNNKDEFIFTYNKVLNQYGIRWNLTMGLYWFRPYTFINLDSRNRAFLKQPANTSPEVVAACGKMKEVPDGEAYFNICITCKKELATGKHEYKSFPELSLAAWEEATADDPYDEWFPSDYSPNLTATDWIKLLGDEAIFNKNCLTVLKCMKDYGGQASCTQLAKKYGRKKNFYNSVSSTVAEKIVKKGLCDAPPLREDGSNRWWPVLYLGRDATKEEAGSFVWKIRDELSDALDKIDLSDIELYDKGTPTDAAPENYWWLTANPKIWSFTELEVGSEQSYTLFNENGNKRRIYQNFLDAKAGDPVIVYEANPVKKIVGLARITQENNGKEIFFEKEESLASQIDYQTIKDTPELKDMEFLKQLNGSLFRLTKDEYDVLKDMIREENPLSLPDEQLEEYNEDDFLNEVYMSEDDMENLQELLINKKNIILKGAPGVGKTFAATRLAYVMMGEKDDSRIETVQFHQNYSYEDFVMGYRPDGNGFKLTEGIFYRFCQKAANNPDKDYFFIIDEINRGNMSKIFGELLMMIEKDYRGRKITMAYNGMKFFVPENLYIIGMMNTADRSIALIDYALRRRFGFFDMAPGFNSDGFIEYSNALNNETFEALIDVVKDLNRTISKDKSLGAGFQIGHSYFCGREELGCSDRWMRSVVEYDIIPTLNEYWFDNPDELQRWERNLRGVLND